MEDEDTKVEVLIWGVEDGFVPPPIPNPEVFRPAAPVVSCAWHPPGFQIRCDVVEVLHTPLPS
eukprot:4883815-Amphidinium_carterae.2